MESYLFLWDTHIHTHSHTDNKTTPNEIRINQAEIENENAWDVVYCAISHICYDCHVKLHTHAHITQWRQRDRERQRETEKEREETRKTQWQQTHAIKSTPKIIFLYKCHSKLANPMAFRCETVCIICSSIFSPSFLVSLSLSVEHPISFSLSPFLMHKLHSSPYVIFHLQLLQFASCSSSFFSSVQLFDFYVQR